MAVLINGDGNKAIYANQDADLIASLVGNQSRISAVGSQMAATVQDANTIAIADGVCITKEGRRIQLDNGKTDIFEIPTGESGVTNYYIIGYHLYTEADSSQKCETFVQKMANSTATITEDTFRGGATDVYVSLYRVTQVGFNITAIAPLLISLANLEGLFSDLASKTSINDSSTTSTTQTWSASKIKTALSELEDIETISSWDNVDKTKIVYAYCTDSTPSHYTVGVSIPNGSSGTYGVQICTSFFSNKGIVYSRSWNGSTWGSWNEYTTQKIESITVDRQSSYITSVEAVTASKWGRIVTFSFAVNGSFPNGEFELFKLHVGPTNATQYFTGKGGHRGSAVPIHGTVDTTGVVSVSTSATDLLVGEVTFIV